MQRLRQFSAPPGAKTPFFPRKVAYEGRRLDDETADERHFEGASANMRFRGWILLIFGLLPTGCASLTDFHYEQTQRARARTAWRDHGVDSRPAAYARDYERGWKDGFYDVATGGKGCPPPVAPCHYWKPEQVLIDGDQPRLAYYSGFQDGAAVASQFPPTHYLRIWSSCECPVQQCETACPTVGCPAGPCGLIEQLHPVFEGGMIEHFHGEIIDAPEGLESPSSDSLSTPGVSPEPVPSPRQETGARRQDSSPADEPAGSRGIRFPVMPGPAAPYRLETSARLPKADSAVTADFGPMIEIQIKDRDSFALFTADRE